MLTLLSEARFWTTRNEIQIKDTDYGAFKYDLQKDSSEDAIAKRSYSEQRGYHTALRNKHTVKLKNGLKRLDEYLKTYKIAYSHWREHNIFQMLFSSGVLVYLCVDPSTGDICRIAFDKYFVGKLCSEQITDALITRMHIIIAYTNNQLTLVYLQKPSLKRCAPEKIIKMDPKIVNIIVGGPPNRKLPRHLACNSSYDLLAIWTKSSKNEVFPWRPTVRDQDRANIHVYKLSQLKLELVSFFWTENDPIGVRFGCENQSLIDTVEQKVSRKGVVTADICVYEIEEMNLSRISVTSIPLQSQVCCHSFSPDNEKLSMGCVDGSVVIYDSNRGITHLVKAAFIPVLITWHSDSAIITITNERSQLQCFDLSLAGVRNQLISEDMTPITLLDLSHYFTTEPELISICWNPKPSISQTNGGYSPTDALLLLSFHGGPFVCLRYFGGTGLRGDVHTSGFTADVLIQKYLNLNIPERAINILLCLNWDTYGAMCLIALHKIATYIFQRPLTPSNEQQIEKALGSFHIPVKPLHEETIVEFGDQVRDITRKFFQFLLRYKSYEKAFRLAIDINDVDLFMDIHNCAKADNFDNIASDAFYKATDILKRSSSRLSDHSSCSTCSSPSTSSSLPLTTLSEDITNANTIRFKELELSVSSSAASTAKIKPTLEIPPLPTFKKSNQPDFLSTNSDILLPPINIPKPELKVSAFSKHQRNYARSIENSPRDFTIPHPTLRYDTMDPPPLPKPDLRKAENNLNLDHQQNSLFAGIRPTSISRMPIMSSTSNSFNPDGSVMRGTPSSGHFDHSYLDEIKPQHYSQLAKLSSPPIIHQHPLISGNIPPAPHTVLAPPMLPIKKKIQHSRPRINSDLMTSSILAMPVVAPRRDNFSSEKNKVKFSDTVTVAVVPEILRKDKPPKPPERPNKPYGLRLDPRRELADSLPLCHPNDEYLKDFMPVGISAGDSIEDQDSKNKSTIKVVHFGIV